MRKHRQNVFERGGRIFSELYRVDWRVMSFDSINDFMRNALPVLMNRSNITRMYYIELIAAENIVYFLKIVLYIYFFLIKMIIIYRIFNVFN